MVRSTLTSGLIQVELHAVEYIESKLSEFDPDNQSSYQGSLLDYKSDLSGLTGQVSDLISTVPSQNRKLITTHESLGYLEPNSDWRFYQLLFLIWIHQTKYHQLNWLM